MGVQVPAYCFCPIRRKPSLRMLRRLEKIESLPAHQQTTLLKTIDTFLKGAAPSR